MKIVNELSVLNTHPLSNKELLSVMLWRRQLRSTQVLYNVDGYCFTTSDFLDRSL